jgi:hypothetical protein
MQLQIDRLIQTPSKPGTWSFNALLHFEKDYDEGPRIQILAGWRIIAGKIYSPAIKISGGYLNVCFIDEIQVRLLYDALKEELPEGILQEYDKATATLRPTEETMKKYLPKLFGEE